MVSSSKLLVGTAALLASSSPSAIGFVGVQPGLNRPSKLNAEQSKDSGTLGDMTSKEPPVAKETEKKSPAKKKGIFSFFSDAIEKKKEEAGFIGGAYIPPDFFDRMNERTSKMEEDRLKEEAAAKKAAEEEAERREIRAKENRRTMLVDVAVLSGGNPIFREQLKKNGVYLDKRDKGDKLETPEGSYQMEEIAAVRMGDYNARSVAIRKIQENGKVESRPSSVIFAFGGSSSLPDKVKQDVVAPVRPFVPDKFLAQELIRQTRFNSVMQNKEFLSENKDVSVVTYSGDSKYGTDCANELQKQGISSKLRQYERDALKLKDPIGALIMTGVNADKLAQIGATALTTNGTHSEISISEISSTQVFEAQKSQGRGMF